LAHPQVATRSCEDCQRYVYDEKTGERQEWPKGSGNPLPRPKGTLPPCGYGPTKCPKGNPTAGRELSESNAMAYRHYLECRAVGQFPDDAVVRQNAAIIRSVEDELARLREHAHREMILAVMGVGATKR